MKWRNGKIYEGEFYKDKKHGRGKLTLESGRIIEGEWIEDVFKDFVEKE